ncbi:MULTISPECIES: EAL domain-containing protein [unclassified Sulfuricurvum]|uniref:EAL domain-containing protein n=1 Tax=unclassified Sulfuricurvum TaxID=2632390 RepID=UPI000299721A|nr:MULTISPECIES: EAL domain-containing protein [unclassified Sulfuricurvum]AFV96318.1 diguanylate cyclase/phosphodiesterase [Candidatus Sulfuricurvum sp. RIFRC-1]HBM36918.1 GGDEF domain-containing protein [Sulfuricurvum sp.]
MTYTEQKEREHRFALALRMGLPIFSLSTITLFALLTRNYTTVSSLIILSIALLGIMVYFIFYLIYQSTNENITDTITHTFTPEYFFRLFKKSISKKTQTLVLISVENLWSINERYGVKNGDKSLQNTVIKLDDFFRDKRIEKLPICRYKGGDFLVFLPGEKEQYVPLIELLLSKYQNYINDDIEIRLEAVMIDSRLSDDIELLVSRLYELHHDRVSSEKEDIYSINELENEIIQAVEKRRFSIGFWPVCCDEYAVFDTTVKLIDTEGRFIHQSRYIPVLNRLNKMRHFESDVLEKIGSLCDDQKRNFVVTISSVTLRNPHFFEHALTLFERYPQARYKITLMFEEKEYCHQLERFAHQIAHYRKAGYKIALDRLGGHHTTLLYLKELEVDIVRFDPLYTRHIKEAGYQNIIQGLNLSAHLCGAKTWVSMIEDEYTYNLVQSLKINYRQGNYLGRILTPEQL